MKFVSFVVVVVVIFAVVVYRLIIVRPFNFKGHLEY